MLAHILCICLQHVLANNPYRVSVAAAIVTNERHRLVRSSLCPKRPFGSFTRPYAATERKRAATQSENPPVGSSEPCSADFGDKPMKGLKSRTSGLHHLILPPRIIAFSSFGKDDAGRHRYIKQILLGRAREIYVYGPHRRMNCGRRAIR